MSGQATSSQPGSAPSASAKGRSGIHAALRYTGIPVSWLTKRPKLPSRNWLIFIGVTSSVLGLYTYDRKQCKKIREEYIKKVEYLSQEPMGSLELPRKVTVYASKWPGDEDSNRSLRFFRKYIKPILVAAAIDYDVQQGRKHGDLARQITDKIKARRRVEEGLEAPLPTPPIPGKLSREEEALRELGGGSIIVGRMTFKEYMKGLQRGWTESPERVDREDALSHALENDGKFDEIEPESPSSSLEGEPLPTKSRFDAATFSPLRSLNQKPTPDSQPSTGSPTPLTPPASIPPQPPLLLVPFLNRIGFKQIPFMIADFFNERARVAAGAEAAYRLVKNYSRPIAGPSAYSGAPLFSPDDKRPLNDLDFDRENESYYLKSLSSYASDIQKAREEYYAKLPDRLATARALARGEREPTKDEQSNPPPTEVELRAERMQKETRWRDNEEGWEIVRPDKDVAWDERFERALRVFEDHPGSDDTSSH